MTGKIIETTGAIQDSADRAGVTAEEYQKWSFAAEQCGMSTETLEKAMIKQQKSFADAKTGSTGMADAYKKLGVDIESIGTSSEAFDITMAKLAGMTDETERNALANDIFGKSYADLTPLLNEGGAGIEALKQKAVDLGGVMSNEAVASGEQFGDTLDQLKTAGTGVFNAVGTSLMPILQKFADWLIANMPAIQETIKKVFDVVSDVVGKAVEAFKTYLLPIIIKVAEWVKLHMPEIKAVAKAVFDVIGAVVKVVADIFTTYFLPVIKAIASWIITNFPIIRDTIKGVFDKIGEFIQGAINKFNAVKDTVIALYDSIKEKFNGIKDTIKGVIDKIKGFLDFNWEFPKLKMPHFSISGSMNPLKWIEEGVPKLSVDWYAKGGIFDKPTLFNTPYGLKGVGDAKSPEVVAPLDNLKEMLGIGNNNILGSEMISLLSQILEAILSGSAIYIDSAKITKSLAPGMSREMASLNKTGSRKIGVVPG